MSVDVFVDTANLYYHTSKEFGGRKIDFVAYMNNCHKLFPKEPTINWHAYVSKSTKGSNGFISYLENLGFNVKSKHLKQRRIRSEIFHENNWAVEIACDIMASKADHIILGSSDTDLIPVLRKKKNIIVYATKIPNPIQIHTRCYNIMEGDLLAKATE